VTGYGLGDRGVGIRVPVWAEFFSSPGRPDWFWGPPNLPYNEDVKRPEREEDHSPPANAEVKKVWIYTSTPICLNGVVLN
jgi:hypothetical protein